MIRPAIRLLKAGAAAAVYYTGLHSAISGIRLKSKVPVLTYHRVLDNARRDLADSHPGIVVSEATFAMHMRALRQHFNPVSIEEFVDHMQSGTALPRRSCLVTFDDGWIDNYDVAFPILQQFDIPAVIFLPTDYISGNIVFWQEEVATRLRTLGASGDLAKVEKALAVLGVRFARNGALAPQFADAIERVKAKGAPAIQAALNYLRGETAGADMDGHYNRYMTWDQVREMADAGISFASHATSHRPLNGMPQTECAAELRQSRQIIEDRLGISVSAIAYPNGDFDNGVVEATREAGFSAGFTTRRGLWQRADQRFEIPRLNIHDRNSGSPAMFVSTCLNLL